jgi:hypothetical protein
VGIFTHAYEKQNIIFCDCVDYAKRSREKIKKSENNIYQFYNNERVLKEISCINSIFSLETNTNNIILVVVFGVIIIIVIKLVATVIYSYTC